MFEIEVVSDPGLGFQDDHGYIENSRLNSVTKYDEALVKPALLFADKVKLLTLREDMSAFVVADSFQNLRMPMRYISSFARLSLRTDSRDIATLGLAEGDLASIEDAATFLSSDRGETLESFAVKYDRHIGNYRKAVGKILKDRSESLASSQIAAAVAAGVLEVERWGDASLDHNQHVWMDFGGEYIPGAVDSLMKRLASRAGAVMLEPNARRALHGSPGLIVDEPDVSEDFHASVATLASVMTAKLPGLTDMPIDEILGLRSDLSQYLAPFRSEMLTMAEEIAEVSDGKPVDLAKEAERKWLRDVAPVLRDIDDLVRRGRYGRHLLSGVASDKATMTSSVSSIMLAVGSTYAGVGALIPAAAAAAFPFVRALNESLSERDEAKKSRLYFLYRVQQRGAKYARGGAS